MKSSEFPEWSPPTLKQQRSGDYLKPRVRFGGLDIDIENPCGTTRKGKNSDGSSWSVKMQNHYGEIVGSKGADGEPVDVYLGDNLDSDRVFIVHQNCYGDWDQYDEDKVMLGFDSLEAAEQAYLSHYDDLRFLGDVSELPLADFKRKVMEKSGEMIKALFDLSGMSCDCENHTLELLTKAFTEDHDIFAPHENPFIARLIELFYSRGLLRIDSVKSSLVRWLSGHEYKGFREGLKRPGMAPVWSPDELSLVKLYLESLPPEQWQLEDYDYLIKYLFQRYLPADELMSDAEWLTTRAHLLGKAQAHLGHLSEGVADALAGALPLTVAQAAQHFALADAEKQILDYARLRAVDLVVSLSDAARHDVKMVVLNHMHQKLAGDPLATPGRLQQDLFDRFAGMNRDWRRIALTEAGEAANQGVIAALPVKSQVKRMEMYNGACAFCRKLDGRVFNVVSADDPDKNGETDIWPGKTNVGRSSVPRKRTDEGLVLREPQEMWWAPAGTVHPHCRGRWQPLSTAAQGDAFADWLKAHLGVQHGLSLADWSVAHAEL